MKFHKTIDWAVVAFLCAAGSTAWAATLPSIPNLVLHLDASDPFRALSESEQIAVGSYLETKYLLGSTYPVILPPPVPEPSSFLLLGMGMMGLRSLRRKKS